MKKAKKTNKRKTLVILVVALSVLLAALILVLVILSGGKPDSGAEPTAPGSSEHTQPFQPGQETQSGEDEAETQISEPESTEDSQSAQSTKPSEPAQTTEPAQEATTATTPSKAEDLKIETPYATLVFPAKWASQVKVEKLTGTPYRVIFTAKLSSGVSQDLFIIAFGGSNVGSVGVVKVSGEEVSVHVSVENINPGKNWSQKDISDLQSMQECLNDVLAGLNLTTPQQEPQETQPPTVPDENTDAMIIDTPYGELKYPTTWKNYLDIKIQDQNGYSVEFRAKFQDHDPVALFVVYFGGDKGVPVGTGRDSSGNTVEIRLEVLELNLDASWDEGEKRMAAAMQEDLNYLLQNLG